MHFREQLRIYIYKRVHESKIQKTLCATRIWVQFTRHLAAMASGGPRHREGASNPVAFSGNPRIQILSPAVLCWHWEGLYCNLHIYPASKQQADLREQSVAVTMLFRGPAAGGRCQGGEVTAGTGHRQEQDNGKMTAAQYQEKEH